MQDIELNCPHCERRFSVLGTLANAEAICPGCVKTVQVPSASEAPLEKKPVASLPKKPMVSKPTALPSKKNEKKKASSPNKVLIPAIIVGVLVLVAAGAWYMTSSGDSTSTTQVASLPVPISEAPEEVMPEDTSTPAPRATTTSSLPPDPQPAQATPQPPPPPTSVNRNRPEPATPSEPVEESREEPEMAAAEETSEEPVEESVPAPAVAPPPSVASDYMAAARAAAVKLNGQVPMAKAGDRIILTLATKKEIVGTLDRMDETSVVIVNELGDQTRVNFDTLSNTSRLAVDRAYRKSIIKALAKRAMSS